MEEEDGIPLEFSLVYNGELDVDLLRDIYDPNQYPEVFIAARGTECLSSGNKKSLMPKEAT
ncbi:MAG: hypothetical protein ACLURP_09630 [Ruminococcus sp.]